MMTDLFGINLMTGVNKREVEHLCSAVDEYRSGKREDERRGKRLCPNCFYFNTSRIGGCAMTNKDCEKCGDTETYSSTCTDKLCAKCSDELCLCKHCGVDIDLVDRPRADNGTIMSAPPTRKKKAKK